MHCTNHNQKEAQGACAYCGRLFCSECLTLINGRYYCKEHVQTLFNEQQNAGAGFGAGANAGMGAGFGAPPNPGYGVPPQNIHIHNHNNNQNFGGGYPYSQKSRIVALILCFFFGVGGFHRFYVGKIGTGLLWLFTFGFFGIGWIVDLISLIFGGFRDANGQPLR